MKDAGPCPFPAPAGEGVAPSTRWCLWHVLSKHPEGLPLGKLVQLVTEEKKEFNYKNPTGAVRAERQAAEDGIGDDHRRGAGRG